MALTFVTSCSESDYDGSRVNSLNKRFLSVSTKELAFSAAASSQRVKVEADQTEWAINAPAKWIDVTPESGNSSTVVKLSVHENKSADVSRACIVTVSSNESDWSQSFPISVTQERNTPYIQAVERNVTCSAMQQEVMFPVKSNTEYSIDNTEWEWLHVKSFSDSCVIVKLDENNMDYEREAVLTLKAKSYPGVNASVTVRQKKANIHSTMDLVRIEHTASSRTFVLNSEASWTSSSTSWISVSPQSGLAGNTEVTVSVPDNESVNSRKGSVYFTISKENNIEVPIEQEGVVLTLSADKLQFDSFEGSKSVGIVSNESWKVKSMPEWVSVNTTEGEKDGEIQVSVQENNTTDDRNGEIVIATANNVASQTIQIVQNAKTVDFENADMYFTYGEGNKKMSFSTDGKWEVLATPDWINVDETSGTGSATLTVSVTENNTLSVRESKLVLIIAGVRYEVNVQQDRKYLSLSSSAFTFNADGGKAILSIGANTEWAVSVEEGNEWISLSSLRGSEDSDLSISVSENKTSSKRRGKIAVTIPNIKTYIVDVVQERRYIKADMQSVDFLKSGGRISFTVTSDWTYKVTRLGSWFGYIQQGDVVTVIAPPNNTSVDRSGAIELTLTNIEGNLTLLVPVRQK